jgi:hypothetical protein
MKNRQKGMSLAEYTIVVFVLVAALLLPVPNSGGKNAITLVMDALKDNHEGYVWGMSLPI